MFLAALRRLPGVFRRQPVRARGQRASTESRQHRSCRPALEALEDRTLPSVTGLDWLHQFGSTAFDSADSVAADGSGVYVAGAAGGTIPGAVLDGGGGQDAYVRKHDAAGNALWTQQFGSAGADEAFGVSSDGTGVYVAGFTSGDLDGPLPGTHQGMSDGFVRKYNPAGTLQWTVQFGTAGADEAFGVSSDGTGVYVVGTSEADGFVRRYDTDGDLAWNVALATGFLPVSVAADLTGVYVAGLATGPDINAFVSKFESDGDPGWTAQFGTTALDQATGVTADASGVYVAGITAGTLAGQTSAGGVDSFVRRYNNADGTEGWTRQFGTAHTDQALGIAVGTAGVFVAGVVSGNFGPGDPPDNVDADAFVRQFDAGGNLTGAFQFGGTVEAGPTGAAGVATSGGVVYVAGGTSGSLETGSPGGGDAFVGRLVVTPPVATVAINLQPASVNLGNQLTLAVTLFGSATLDVSQVNVASVRFEGATPFQAVIQDVNNDGRPDLVLRFLTLATDLLQDYIQLLQTADTVINGVLDPGVSTHQSTTVTLTATTLSGQQLQGTDTVDLFLSGWQLLLLRLILGIGGTI